ncbi:MAG: hypothetical protein AABY91_01380 [Gemmatimonadota bacterium]|mgnify:CR=1 FL=1
MDVSILIARALHIGLGVFWAGAMIFVATFLLPSIQEAGPDGAKVTAGLARRRFIDIMPVVALVTVVSGFYLYWKSSTGLSPEYMGSRTGMAIGLGSVTALLALALGLATVRPSMKRAMELAQAAGAAAESREAILAEAQASRAKAAGAAKVVAWLLAATTIAMAGARYL